MISKNGERFSFELPFGGPRASGRNDEARRAAAIRNAGYEPKVFIRLPDYGSIALSAEGRNRVEKFQLNNSIVATAFELHNSAANTYTFELRMQKLGEPVRVFRDKKSVQNNGSQTWVLNETFRAENGKLRIGLRAADPFAQGGFMYWGMNSNGTVTGLDSFRARRVFDQAAGKMYIVYAFGIR